MERGVFFRCVVVSLVIALITTFVSTTIVSVPKSGEFVMDLEHVDADGIEHMSDQEFLHHIESIPYRQVSGLERFTYAFTHPQIWYFLARAFFTWFVALLIATLLISFWNLKEFNKTLKARTPDGAA